MNQLKFLIIHSTATPPSHNVTAEEIINLHCSKPIYDATGKQVGGGHGWSRPGYTYLLKLDGTIEQIWADNNDSIVDANEFTFGILWTANTGEIITHALQIVLEGGCDDNYNSVDTRTPKQLETLKEFTFSMLETNPDLIIGGHRQFPGQATVCPGHEVPEWLRSIGIQEKNIYKG